MISPFGVTQATADFGAYDYVRDLAVQPDGRILVVGTSYSNEGDGQLNIGLARFTRAGRLDSRFGEGGRVLTDINQFDHGNSLALLRDGSFLVGGTSVENRVPGGAVVVRYHGNTVRRHRPPGHLPGGAPPRAGQASHRGHKEPVPRYGSAGTTW